MIGALRVNSVCIVFSRARDYYWYCVKEELPMCDNSVISSHVGLAMIKIPWFPSYCDGKVKIIPNYYPITKTYLN